MPLEPGLYFINFTYFRHSLLSGEHKVWGNLFCHIQVSGDGDFMYTCSINYWSHIKKKIGKNTMNSVLSMKHDDISRFSSDHPLSVMGICETLLFGYDFKYSIQKIK